LNLVREFLGRSKAAELRAPRSETSSGFANFHKVVASFHDDMLSTAIHRYAGGFNRRHRRRRHVFDSPFTSTEVVTEQHAFHLPDYIAENPPYRPWPWSSFDADVSFVQRLSWFENA